MTRGDRGTGSRASGPPGETSTRESLARTLADCANRVGGILSVEDLAGYRARFEEPARTRYRGYEILLPEDLVPGPAPAADPEWLLEHFDLRAMGHNSPAYVHTVVEASEAGHRRPGWAFYGDPDALRPGAPGWTRLQGCSTRPSGSVSSIRARRIPTCRRPAIPGSTPGNP